MFSFLERFCKGRYRIDGADFKGACAAMSSNLISITMKKAEPNAADCLPIPGKRPRGRPRCFDRDAALKAAMDVFWKKGFEGATLADLTEAMGINPPSLYAAFGDKEGLFLEAVKRYRQQVAEKCLYAQEPTAHAAVEKLLTELASLYTDNEHPRGCLMVMAATTAGASSPRLQEVLAEQRAAARASLRARLDRGVKDGELPADTDVAALTNFYAAVISGMSLQARDGATRKSLMATVEAAMRAWPGQVPAKRKRAAAAA
jgi:TetR/AcrR family transcriptional regulator, copper-responsive repressor